MSEHLHLGVALVGYGWHPQAWRQTDAEPVTSGRYWAGLAATAERGLPDFLTVDDTLTPQPAGVKRSTPVAWPAVPTPARIAPATQHIGLIPVATVTHTRAVPRFEINCHA
jgi:alkanesulfonate monooxygenase SsuD/methylene tetrahydromethanopterin reductase-like flavin-dependent oxidoreductase (luciferase family)